MLRPSRCSGFRGPKMSASSSGTFTASWEESVGLKTIRVPPSLLVEICCVGVSITGSSGLEDDGTRLIPI